MKVYKAPQDDTFLGNQTHDLCIATAAVWATGMALR